MVAQSVVAAVDSGNDHADHFSLGACQRGVAIHQGFVEVQMINERWRIQTVNLHDVVDFARFRIGGAAISTLQFRRTQGLRALFL